MSPRPALSSPLPPPLPSPSQLSSAGPHALPAVGPFACLALHQRAMMSLPTTTVWKATATLLLSDSGHTCARPSSCLRACCFSTSLFQRCQCDCWECPPAGVGAGPLRERRAPRGAAAHCHAWRWPPPQCLHAGSWALAGRAAVAAAPHPPLQRRAVRDTFHADDLCCKYPQMNRFTLGSAIKRFTLGSAMKVALRVV